jgi:hypothetical protein
MEERSDEGRAGGLRGARGPPFASAGGAGNQAHVVISSEGDASFASRWGSAWYG